MRTTKYASSLLVQLIISRVALGALDSCINAAYLIALRVTRFMNGTLSHLSQNQEERIMRSVMNFSLNAHARF